MILQTSLITPYCTHCDWSTIVAPSSDVLTPGVDHFDNCPRCGQTLASPPPQASLEMGIAQVFNTLEKWFKH